jgi:hypothetical protein
MLTGPPAATLMTFAKSRHVTEMVLAPTGAGRHLVLRELARGGSGVELHILPIRARTS